MNTKITIALVLLALSSLGSVVLAQSPSSPSNVTGIAAVYENGTVTVRWSAATDAAGISSYRIYFSRVSILQNAGDYDDFEQTMGPDTSYTFTKPPYTGQSLYFSVLAVNSAGVESDAFVEEAHVDVPGTSSSEQSSLSLPSGFTDSSASSESAMSSPSALPLLLTQAVSMSSTGVALVFSQPLNEQSIMLPAEFVILDGSGARLMVQAGIYKGNVIELTTDPQRNGTVYIVASIMGALQSAAGAPYVAGSPVTFVGQGMAMSQPPQDLTPPEDVPTIQISPMKQKDGTYDVRVSWAPSLNGAGDLAEYLLSITRDGVTSSPVTPVAGTVTNVAYSHIAPGPFGVRVQTKDQAGNISEGSVSIVTLPASSLPHTGVGLIGVALVSGAVAGRTLMRKRAIA